MTYKPTFVCSNPSCKSYGTAHYNCRCEGPGEQYSNGGLVHYCSTNQPHDEKCEHFADGGVTRDNLEFQNNPDLAVDHAITSHGLHHALTKIGHTRSEAIDRTPSDFLDHSRRGKKALHTYTDSLTDSKAPRHESNAEKVQALHSHLEELNSNPDKAFEVGGSLGDHMPMHHGALAAKTATVVNYLQSIKPQSSQAAPLDRLLPPSRSAQKNYQRQVELAEDPKLIFQHAKDGTLIPQDFQTLDAIYPKLRERIQDKAFETLATAKAEGRNLTHTQKRRLGALVGQHLTYVQSPQAAQAIMKANAPAQAPQPSQKSPKKATNVELKQINKVNELSETPLQKLQTARNS